MTATQESINIENVVASTGIGQELGLESVVMDLTGSQFDPDQFPGLVYRMQDPKGAALIFSLGTAETRDLPPNEGDRSGHGRINACGDCTPCGH